MTNMPKHLAKVGWVAHHVDEKKLCHVSMSELIIIFLAVGGGSFISLSLKTMLILLWFVVCWYCSNHRKWETTAKLGIGDSRMVSSQIPVMHQSTCKKNAWANFNTLWLRMACKSAINIYKMYIDAKKYIHVQLYKHVCIYKTIYVCVIHINLHCVGPGWRLEGSSDQCAFPGNHSSLLVDIQIAVTNW